MEFAVPADPPYSREPYRPAMPAVKCRCGAKVKIPDYKMNSPVACPVCRQPLAIRGQIGWQPVEPQAPSPEPAAAPWQVAANLRRSPSGRKTIGIALIVAAVVGLALASGGWWVATRTAFLATAEGAAVDSFLRKALPDGKYNVDLWIGPRRIEALEDAMIQEESAELTKLKEAFSELEGQAAIIGRDLTAQERADSRRSAQTREKRLADLKRMRPMKFFRMKYRHRDEQGAEQSRDQIFWVDAREAFQVPAPIASRFLGHFDE